MAEQALSHLKVIDLTHYLAGPYCTKLLAGFGAEVIKIERPKTGDALRGAGPFYGNESGVERSIPFLYLNTGKKSVSLDLKSDEGIAILKRLVATADVLVENFSPRVMPGLGLDYAALREINPRLVMASISNFGQTGPYRDYKADEISLQAMSGLMHMTGEPDKPPLAAGPALDQYCAGLHAYAAILMALFQCGVTGQGQHIDVSIVETGIENIETRLANYLHDGKTSKRGPHTFAPWGLYPCRDGYVAVIGAPFRHWTEGAKMFDSPTLLEEKYKHVRGRAQNREEVDAVVRPWMKSRGKKDIVRAALEHKLAFGYLATFDEVLESEQHAARGFFKEVEHPVTGRHRYCDAPYKMSETPWQTHRAPRLGEHNNEICASLGFCEEDMQALSEKGVI